ncbi:MAG: short-chain dehydrogenase [Idiomarina sp.]|uniref:SDR family NAD(P)-dependent oxidoreductase n=1 Tax=Idiomarina sp. TaxID=1874361 RepID=UPI000C675151|nr:SDR family NAD(P)-dependent oxidoreductase [Idiomarina sp.]MAK70950.1 short-chain dehydrogenase [Idiomarinaceae bacterium]MBT42434.1 short-chain dehydrogenase [Idiomarina sp.]HAD49194.1 short-chain dehydrogenase [Idiomarina sp.]
MNILITGATSGIGYQLAQDYAKQGHTVIACGRNQEALDELADIDRDNIQTLRFDITDIENTKQALADIERVDLAILSAGMCEYLDVKQFDAGMFERVFRVNVFGTMNTVEALLPIMPEGSKLVIVGSLARLLPFTKAQAYGGSKAAIQYITRTLEVDLKEAYGIDVLGVSPGFVKTPMTDANDFEMPMRVSVEFASKAIRKGIEKGKRDIGFPALFSGMLRVMSLLPQGMQVALSRRMAKNS